MPDGTIPTPGGWNRFSLEVPDLVAAVEMLRGAAHTFETTLSLAWAGKQILVEDPSGNPVELFEPTRDEARLDLPERDCARHAGLPLCARRTARDQALCVRDGGARFVKLKALLIGLTLVVAGCGSSAVKSDTTTTKPTTTTTFLCPNGEPPTTNPDTSPAQLPFHYTCNSQTYTPLPSGTPTTTKP